MRITDLCVCKASIYRYASRILSRYNSDDESKNKHYDTYYEIRNPRPRRCRSRLLRFQANASSGSGSSHDEQVS